MGVGFSEGWPAALEVGADGRGMTRERAPGRSACFMPGAVPSWPFSMEHSAGFPERHGNHRALKTAVILPLFRPGGGGMTVRQGSEMTGKESASGSTAVPSAEVRAGIFPDVL